MLVALDYLFETAGKECIMSSDAPLILGDAGGARTYPTSVPDFSQCVCLCD